MKSIKFNLFECILASLCSLWTLLVGFDDTGHGGDLVEEFELAVEEGVGQAVETFDDGVPK